MAIDSKSYLRARNLSIGYLHSLIISEWMKCHEVEWNDFL
jgi:hypothetical protein